MLDVRRLRLLHDLDRLGTIAAVAGLHRYTPSAVSQQLSALEREAGVPLLERTGRRVTLTAAGRVLVRHAGAVLAALESAGAALAAARTGPSGPLRIGAFPTAVRTILPPALVALGREHPALDLMVTELDPAAVPAALRDRTLDAGLIHAYDPAPIPRSGPALTVPAPLGPASPSPPSPDLASPDLASPAQASPDLASPAPADREPVDRQSVGPASDDLESVALFDEAVHLAVPAAAGPAATVADLRDRDWITATPGTLCHGVTMRVCGDAGFTPRVRHQADDFTAVLALVAAGQGVSLVPALATTAPPPGVRLLPVPTRRRTRLAYRRGAAGHPAVAALTAALHAAIRTVVAAP
ncbi:LysR family transcriptional regulator [Actinoplanes sp. NPDC023714]|uniref:LysR family transcriptional regulator n=1 Tax=Actinoplanes sp. NPDC023714 TaxID=3154322 RepID=UPI00340E483F